VIDPAQDPVRVWHQVEQPEPNAIRRCAVDGETVRAGLAVLAPRFDPHTFVPGHGMAHAGLRHSRCNDGGFAKILRGFEQCI
jgi:hypothetical protein